MQSSTRRTIQSHFKRRLPDIATERRTQEIIGAFPSPAAPEDGRDFVIPYHVIDEHVGDTTDTEQHKAHRATELRKYSIKHYRCAITKRGAALEGFSPMWVRTTSIPNREPRKACLP